MTTLKTLLVLILFCSEAVQAGSFYRISPLLQVGQANIKWTTSAGQYGTSGIVAGGGFMFSLFPDALIGLRVVALETYVHTYGTGSGKAQGQSAHLSGGVPMISATANLSLNQGNFRNSYGLGWGMESLAALKRNGNFPILGTIGGPLIDVKITPKSSRLFGYGQFFLPLSSSLDLHTMLMIGGGFELGNGNGIR